MTTATAGLLERTGPRKAGVLGLGIPLAWGAYRTLQSVTKFFT